MNSFFCCQFPSWLLNSHSSGELRPRPTHTLAGCTGGQAEVSSGGSICRRALWSVAFEIQKLQRGYAHPIACVSWARETWRAAESLSTLDALSFSPHSYGGSVMLPEDPPSALSPSWTALPHMCIVHKRTHANASRTDRRQTWSLTALPLSTNWNGLECPRFRLFSHCRCHSLAPRLAPHQLFRRLHRTFEADFWHGMEQEIPFILLDRR